MKKMYCGDSLIFFNHSENKPDKNQQKKQQKLELKNEVNSTNDCASLPPHIFTFARSIFMNLIQSSFSQSIFFRYFFPFLM